MTVIKERIIGAITIMNDDDANLVWNLIQNELAPRDWSDIQSVAPDEIDLQMLTEIKEDPDCHEFISEKDVMKELGI